MFLNSHYQTVKQFYFKSKTTQMTNSTKTLNVLIAMDRKIKQISRGQIFTDFLTNQEILKN